MAMAFLLAIQAAAIEPVAIDFDLARLGTPVSGLAALGGGCGRDDPGAIVVCGRRVVAEGYPLGEAERRYGRRPLVAETGIGRGVVARSYVEAVALDRGAVSNRVMIGVRIPF